MNCIRFTASPPTVWLEGFQGRRGHNLSTVSTMNAIGCHEIFTQFSFEYITNTCASAGAVWCECWRCCFFLWMKDFMTDCLKRICNQRVVSLTRLFCVQVSHQAAFIPSIVFCLYKWDEAAGWHRSWTVTHERVGRGTRPINDKPESRYFIWGHQFPLPTHFLTWRISFLRALSLIENMKLIHLHQSNPKHPLLHSNQLYNQPHGWWIVLGL